MSKVGVGLGVEEGCLFGTEGVGMVSVGTRGQEVQQLTIHHHVGDKLAQRSECVSRDVTLGVGNEGAQHVREVVV